MARTSSSDRPDLGQCANCDRPAVVKTDGVSADVVGFCQKHRPPNLQ